MSTNTVTNIKLQREVMQKKIKSIGLSNLKPDLRSKVNDYENIYAHLSQNFRVQIINGKGYDRYMGDANHIKITSSLTKVGTFTNLRQFLSYGDTIIDELCKK